MESIRVNRLYLCTSDNDHISVHSQIGNARSILNGYSFEKYTIHQYPNLQLSYGSNKD